MLDIGYLLKDIGAFSIIPVPDRKDWEKQKGKKGRNTQKGAVVKNRQQRKLCLRAQQRK